MIALALCCQPAVLLADEPTMALDVTVHIQIILLLAQLQHQLGMSVIFITHDVGVAVEVADQIAGMDAGFVEVGPTEAVIGSPARPSTTALLTSSLLGCAIGKRLEATAGMPHLRALPAACPFSPRCGFADERCRAAQPARFQHAAGHKLRCLRVAGREIALAGPNLGERSVTAMPEAGDRA